MTGPGRPDPAAGTPGAVAFDVIVLAGGRGSRLGGVSKPDVQVAGRSLLDRALDAAGGARHVVLVGPPALGRPGLVTVLEDPPFGGPVAGIDAALTALEHLRAADPGATTAPAAAVADGVPVLVLACDIPGAAAAVPDLLAVVLADPGVDGALLVREGHPQLVAVHRPAPLRVALDGLRRGGGVHGVSVRRLHGDLRMVPVADVAGHSADADTWDDVARLGRALARDRGPARPTGGYSRGASGSSSGGGDGVVPDE